MEAGANLPDSGLSVIQPGKLPSDAVSLVVNPRGGIQNFYAEVPMTVDLPVDDASAFKTAAAIAIVRADRTLPVEIVAIAAGYETDGYAKGLKQDSSGQDFVRLSGFRALHIGDAVYGYAKEDYSLESADLRMGDMVLAEDIDSLGMSFLDNSGKPTKDWNTMHSARLTVTARTQRPDQSYPGDGYRRVTVTSEVRLRNRL